MLARLSLRGNPIGGGGAVAFVESHEWQALGRLRFSDVAECSIGPGLPDVLADVLRGSGTIQLKYLDIGFNDLGAACVPRGAPALAERDFLRELSLASNNMGDDGAEALATALARNAVLTSLDLSDNGITDTRSGSRARASGQRAQGA